MIPVATAFAAQAKSAVRVPGGLGFAQFSGYEDWQSVGPSQTSAQSVIRLIPANRDIWQERAINPVEIVALDALDLLVVVDNESDTLSSVDKGVPRLPELGRLVARVPHRADPGDLPFHGRAHDTRPAHADHAARGA